jgi:hypothetical protein
MGESKTVIYKFLFNRIKNSIILGLIISIIIIIFFGKNILNQYFLGFLLGVLNFSILTLGIDLILYLKPLTARIFHFLFFTIRYLAIAIVIALFITRKHGNAFIVVGGLLTMHLSLFMTEMKKHLLARKEG